MTNNLKILVILSIFVFILTGYFYFSPTFAKNQIITNSNSKEEKDDKEIIDINNKDNNKKDNKEKKNGSLISAVLRLIIFTIFIVIVGVIVFIIVKRKKVNKFEFNIKSKKDFAKENFCPTFFTIHIPKVIEKSKKEEIKIDDVKEDAESFFKILTELILPKKKINNINKVEFFRAPIENKNNAYCFNLKNILDEINNFALYSKELETNGFYTDQEMIKPFIKPLKNNVENVKSKIKESKAKIEEIEKKYGEEFDSYLCAYLLYYLSETIGNNGIKVEISDPKKEERVNKHIKIYFNFKLPEFCDAAMEIRKIYKVNYDMINEILKRLLNDNQLQNVTYKEF